MSTRPAESRRLTLKEAGERHFEVIIPAERYRLRVPGLLLTLEADQLHWKSGELHGQLEVSLDLHGVATLDGTADSSSMNFSRLADRHSRASALGALSKTPEYPWGELLQLFSLHLLKAERDGDPGVDLRDVELDPSITTSEEVLGLPIARYDPIMLVAKGGDGKSLLALRILGDLNRRGFQVGFLDNEWNEIVHRDRLGKQFDSPLPSVHYLRLQRPFTIEAPRVRRFVHERGLDFVAVDSVGLGTDGPMEYSEAPLAFGRAIRSLGRIGSILLSHTKHDATDGTNKRPYGSPYWLNLCRDVWYLKSAESGPGRLEALLENIKVNAGARRQPVALRFEFGERIRIERVSTGDLDELSDSLPIRDRIVATMKRRGAISIDDLADDLDAKRDSVKKAIHRDLQKVFIRVETIGGETKTVKYGLLERRTA
ncbi:MAG TPA: hypothetical protein VES67_06090 [Vicinamibacterales bacterium]|nr:hypothetical protein [Vicinamibacterales bacterium]